MLNIRGLTRRFGSITALAGIDLDVHAGEVFALLGGSGSGKTTLLRCIAGFERPDSGNIDMLGENLLRLPPYKRPLNTMFQSYALFPHMTVAGNIAFGLRHLDRTARTRRVDEMLELVRLQGLGNRRPDQLSGGQRQRVALARALARRPALLLLDEPLSALDRALREGTRAELLELQRRLGTTFIVVTHDQEEALGMATRIGIMQEGRLVQVGSPAEVYERPVNRFVAAFLGAANILSGIVVSADQVRVGEVTVSCVPGSCRSVGASVFLAVRPERIALGQADNTVRGRLRDIAYRGDAYVLTVASEAGMDLRVIADTSEVAGLTPGCSVLLGWLPASTIVLSDSNE